jgi:formylglycine-generating enzyme required for sulfatase activity
MLSLMTVMAVSRTECSPPPDPELSTVTATPLTPPAAPVTSVEAPRREGAQDVGTDQATTGQRSLRPLRYLNFRNWGTHSLPGTEANQHYSGDLWGLWECDASHMYDGRPGFERVGCMVPLPGPDLRRALFRVSGGLSDDAQGNFLMGAQSTDPDGPGYDVQAGDDEAPPHHVTLSPYWLQRMEITIHQYRLCLISGACRLEEIGVAGAFHFDGDLNRSQLGPPKKGDERPINGVTWEGARRYCNWVGGRLPTEAEWEYAARSGRLQHRYPWGDEPPTCRRAVFKGSASQPCGVTSASSEFSPDGHHTPSHILHQAGNLWEWTADWYAPNYYERSPRMNPKGPKTGPGRVQRGGSYSDDDPAVLRAAFRAQMDPTLKMPDVGFRCASDRVAHHPITALFEFTDHALTSWSAEASDDPVAWRLDHGYLTTELHRDRETLRWHKGRFDGAGVLTLRVLPMLAPQSSVALLYGVQDARNYYRAEIYPAAGVARLIRVLDGVEGVFGEATGLRLPNGGWLSLHIRWRDGRHRLSHSALNLAHGEDSTWASGGVGMRLKGPGKATFEAAFTTP